MTGIGQAVIDRSQLQTKEYLSVSSTNSQSAIKGGKCTGETIRHLIYVWLWRLVMYVTKCHIEAQPRRKAAASSVRDAGTASDRPQDAKETTNQTQHRDCGMEGNNRARNCQRVEPHAHVPCVLMHPSPCRLSRHQKPRHHNHLYPLKIS